MWAREYYGGSHPFVNKKFQLMGREAYLHLPDHGEIASAQNVDSNQLALLDVIKHLSPAEAKRMQVIWQSLKDVEYKDDDRIVWNALYPHVVVDPSREFGQPIIGRTSVPTKIVVKTLNSYRSRDAVISGFGLTDDELDAAIIFEESLSERRAAA